MLCLTACAKTPVVEKLKPPPERLSCAPQPAPPVGNSDAEKADFVISLIDAGQNCRDALQWVKDWSNDQ